MNAPVCPLPGPAASQASQFEPPTSRAQRKVSAMRSGVAGCVDKKSVSPLSPSLSRRKFEEARNGCRVTPRLVHQLDAEPVKHVDDPGTETFAGRAGKGERLASHHCNLRLHLTFSAPCREYETAQAPQSTAASIGLDGTLFISPKTWYQPAPILKGKRRVDAVYQWFQRPFTHSEVGHGKNH